uniref:MGA conserved domain-containing protein n=1 Tax=Bactrocera dorsalis TaxID=27457 RepID=A0A034V5L6_BACDO
MHLTKHQLKIIPRIQRKYNVSIGFLKSNLAKIEKFLWYALSPRLVIKRVAIRKGSKQRIILNYYHLRRVLFDQAERKVFKTRRRNVQLWSKQIVSYLRRKYGVKEHIEITSLSDNADTINKQQEEIAGSGNMAPDEVSKQLKEQLEILRSGKRTVPLMESETKSIVDETRNDSVEAASSSTLLQATELLSQCPTKVVADSNQFSHITSEVLDKTESAVQSTLETTPEKQIMGSDETRSEQPKHSYKADRNIDIDGESVELPPVDTATKTATDIATKSTTEMLQQCADKKTTRSLSNNSNFLDMLMNKVRGKNVLTETASNTKVIQSPPQAKESADTNVEKAPDNNEHFTDSGEEFFGFDETERLPGMLLTPLVPFSAQSKGNANVAFISESLNEFMRENLLESSNCVADGIENAACRRHRQATLGGLVTPDCIPPQMQMPLVPESLQKLRTVAERRQFLQKFNRNHKLAIINNEAAICRELQRKMRHHKSKSVSQQSLQAPNSQMPFTRQGWQAASFVTTEFNHYYYQTLDVIDGNERERVRLPGVRGNNEQRNKQPYLNRVPSNFLRNKCNPNTCSDALIGRDLKPVKAEPDKKKLNKTPLPSVFKPCPLSHKPFQKPLDDETAPLLLAGGSMAVVRMPIVELEVFPALGKPLHDVAKRYLDYILPHCDITREWAEFSVSTLQQSAECRKNDDQSKDGGDDTKVPTESYTFPIPYMNDRSHILVRRVVDRSEKLDETFEATTSPIEDFSFRANIDERDSELVECADVLSEMINSVAISCSENSFIKIDPDGLQTEKEENVELKQEKVVGRLKEEKSCNIKSPDESKLVNQAAANKKQNRLLLELRRLNATIIDAAVKAEKGAKPCTKEYCTFGCICQSLADDYPLRQHCGKSKCVIECTCKTPSQSRIMRLETDGRSITTEDAFMLRRQATARLARMEKEFTSTIVLTENETLLINESQYDKKRRCTKAPKRYEDFADTEEDYAGRTSAITPPKKTQNTAVVAIEAATDTTLNTGFSETTTELREPIYVNDNVLEKLKHCTVPLIRLENIQNMAVWCMVHELYKCYCGGRATDGKPLVIEKDNNVTSSNEQTSAGNKQNASTEDDYIVTSTKARYSFETVEQAVDEADAESREENEIFRKRREKRKSADRKSQGSVVKYNSTDDERDESDREDEMLEESLASDYNGDIGRAKRPKLAKRLERRGRPSELAFINKYFNTDVDGCRRVVVVPRKTYLRINRKRRFEVEEFIAKNENKQSMLLLNEHIMRSVYYHKHEVEKQRKEAAQESLLQTKKRKLNDVELTEPEDTFHKDKQSDKEPIEPAKKKERQVVELIDEDSSQSSVSSLLSVPDGKPTADTKLQSKRKRLEERKLQSGKKLEEDNAAYDNSTHIEEDSDPTSSTTDSKNTQQVKTSENTKITENAYTISDDDAQPSVSSTVSDGVTDLSAAPSESLGALSTSRLDFFRDVVRSMNNLVNKKMQDIGLALKRESKVIPAPNNDILCIIKWSNFLDAFIEGFVFIWQVKLRDEQTFFAATINNMMPMVLDAVGVVNIAALPMQQLPLMGRMLLQRCRTSQTRDLAIVMQGRAKYWLVKGFLRADKSSACAKPTPKTHPLLTRKINVLSSLLAKQHIRELNKKVAQKQLEELTATETANESTATSTQNIALTQQSLLRTQPPPLAHLEKETKPTQNIKNVQKTKLPEASETKGTLQKKPEPAITRATLPTGTISTKTSNAAHKLKSGNGLSMLQELIGNSQYSEMKTNIAFRKVMPHDIDEMNVLDVTSEPHRWLVLDLYRDFSHIYVPDFQELVSLDRIQKVMSFSRQKQKIVKLQFFKDAAYDAFVIPHSERKIFFGPLKLNMPPPLLILLQSVDRKMMLRETYQQMHNIQSGAKESTTAFWVVRKNGQVYLDYKLDGSAANTAKSENAPVAELQAKETVQLPESDDDDCMIVEDEEPSGSFSALEPLPPANITVKPLSELQSTLNPSIPARQLTNYTIQSSANSNRLQITNMGTTPVSNNSVATTVTETPTAQLKLLQSGNNADFLTGTQLPQPPPITMNGTLNSQLVQLTNTSQSLIPPLADKQSAAILCSLPPNAVITGVAPAPKEAPYSTTIYISNVASTVPLVANGAQGNDKPFATTLETNAQTSAKTSGQTVINTSENMSNVRFLTPDVRVTATGDTTPNELFTTPALTTMSNTNTGFVSLPVSQQQNSILDKRESVGNSTQSPSTAGNTTKAMPQTATERQHTPGEVKSSNNISAGDWKRFLLGDNGKRSTIGSTTITKVADKLESAGKLVMNIEGDEFEPAASVLIKPNAPTLPSEAPEVPLVAAMESNTNKCTLNGTTAITTIGSTAISAKTKKATKSATIAVSRPNTSSTNTTNTNVRFRSLPTLKESKIAQPVKTTVIFKSPTPTHSAATKPKPTILNSIVAMSKAPSVSTSNATTTQQSFNQQLKISSHSMQPSKAQSFASRQSLPTLPRNLINSPITNGGSVNTPKPLINIRPAIPIPQRVSTTKPTTQRLSDSALYAPNMLNNRRLSVTNVATKPTETSKTNTQLAKTKSSEQYGVLCSSTNDGSPKFWAKRMHNSYLIKVPGVSSVVHRTDLESADTFLNQHLLKQSPAMKSKLPIKWKFVPSEQLNLPIKRLTTKKNEKLVVRCAKPAENSASEVKVVKLGTDCNVVKDADNATATTLDKNCCEPILIED